MEFLAKDLVIQQKLRSNKDYTEARITMFYLVN
jgi:hypothetical protein